MNKTPSDKKGNKPVVRAKRVARPPVGDPVEERLSSIYRDEQGDLPDFDQLDRKRSFWWLRTTVWIVIIACAVSVTAWVGFLVWRP
jgi:type VI protein secretion system component VasF